MIIRDSIDAHGNRIIDDIPTPPKRQQSLAERESLNKLIRLPRESFVKVLLHSRSKYMPHQGMKETSRRLAQASARAFTTAPNPNSLKDALERWVRGEVPYTVTKI